MRHPTRAARIGWFAHKDPRHKLPRRRVLRRGALGGVVGHAVGSGAVRLGRPDRHRFRVILFPQG